MKKTWIKVKRGILEPKHREAIGVRIWLFLYMLDQVDWETGQIPQWRDKETAKDLGMSIRTLQTQRQELEEAGYITCRQSLHHQEVTVLNWTNPREYSGEVLNGKDHDTRIRVPSDDHDTRNQEPYGSRKPRTIYLNPHLKDSHLKESQWNVPEKLQTLEFEDAFMDFLDHRKQIKKKVTQIAGERLLKKLSRYSVDTAIAMLDQSMENGWQGVFEVKGQNGKLSGRGASWAQPKQPADDEEDFEIRHEREKAERRAEIAELNRRQSGQTD